MPVWIQMTAALSSALLGGGMGIALIPFLQKCRFCDPDENAEQKNSETVSGNKLKPTMCGILLIFGCMAGFVLSHTLWMQFSGTDRTGTAFQSESFAIRLMLIQGFIFGFLGWMLDYQRTVRKRIYSEDTDFIVILLVFFLNYAFLKFFPSEEVLDFGFFQWDAGALSLPIKTGLVTFFWLSMQKPEQNVDGISVTLGSVQLLSLTVLCLAGKQYFNALYALSAAGACFGCYYWNLYPAKCRLGQTGTYWLGITIPMICLNYGRLDILLLYFAVWLLNSIPLIFQKKTLLFLLQQDGKSPIQRIIILTGFGLFCSILSLMPERV